MQRTQPQHAGIVTTPPSNSGVSMRLRTQMKVIERLLRLRCASHVLIARSPDLAAARRDAGLQSAPAPGLEA